MEVNMMVFIHACFTVVVFFFHHFVSSTSYLTNHPSCVTIVQFITHMAQLVATGSISRNSNRNRNNNRNRNRNTNKNRNRKKAKRWS